jgi:hypothetical protein
VRARRGRGRNTCGCSDFGVAVLGFWGGCAWVLGLLCLGFGVAVLGFWGGCAWVTLKIDEARKIDSFRSRVHGCSFCIPSNLENKWPIKFQSLL